MPRPLIFILLLTTVARAAETKIPQKGEDQARLQGSEKLLGEECALPLADGALPLGLRDGDQVRIRRHDDNGFALFTVRADTNAAEGTVLISARGQKRLGYADAGGQTVTLRLPAFDPATTPKEARARGELVEILETNHTQALQRRDLLLLAPHGGSIEIGTDVIARRVLGKTKKKRAACLWTCLGYRKGGGAYARWHITSTDLSERSFPKLGELAAKAPFAAALSIHGHSGKAILIGGRGCDALKGRIKTALEALDLGVDTRILKKGERFSGTAADNIVNRYSENGIQLELPRSVRTRHAEAVGDALAEVFNRP